MPDESGRVWVRPFMFSGRNTRLKYMNSKVMDVQHIVEDIYSSVFTLEMMIGIMIIKM